MRQQIQRERKILPWPKTQSQRAQVQRQRGGSFEMRQETQRRHPIWTVHLHGHKGNWLHNPCLESQWWENSMPRCIQIQAAQNNLHPSKRETKEKPTARPVVPPAAKCQAAPATAQENNTSSSTNSHPRHCYPTSANWDNAYQSNPTTATVQITTTEQIHIWWSSEGLHQINVEWPLNIDQMLSTMIMNTEHLFRYWHWLWLLFD